MSFPTETVLTAGTILQVQQSIGNRTLPTITITVRGSGADAGATTVPINVPTFSSELNRSVGQILVQKGTKLTFSGTPAVTVELTADINVIDGNTTPAPTPTMSVKPLTNDLPGGRVATTSGLLRVLGGDNVEFNVTDNEVSTRSFENGLFDDARKVMIGGSLPFNGFYRVGDRCFETVIKPNILTAGEVYFYLLYPDNVWWSGYAFIKGYKETAKLDDIRRFSWEFRAVGEFNTGTLP